MELIIKSDANTKGIKEKLDSNMSEIQNENLLRELFHTIEKFNITIHNQQLIDNILDFTDKNLNSVTKQIIEEFDKQENFEKIKNKELVQIIEKLEFQIRKLNDQNESLVNKHKSEQREKYDESVDKLNLRNKEEKIKRQETENQLLQMKIQLKDSDNFRKTLDDQLREYKHNYNTTIEKLKEMENLKNHLSNLELEIKNKDSIINYLEALIKLNKNELAITENSKNNNCTTENNEFATKTHDYMKSLSVYKDKTHPNEYESEFDFSEYLTNKKAGRNPNGNSISINEIQNFNGSSKDFLKTKNNLNNNNLNKIEETERDDKEIQKNNLSDNPSEMTRKEKDKELKDLIFQESTASKDIKKNIKRNNNPNYSIKNKNIKPEVTDSALNTANNEISNKDANNTEIDNDTQASRLNSNIKIEIEHLDEEIKELQNKLKTMISK